MSTEEGCYLTYESDSGGKLMLTYSRTAIESAIGFWAAGEGKKIQGFKFNSNGGRQELIKGIAGGDANKKKFYSGWAQFVKESKNFNGSVRKNPNCGGLEVDLYLYMRDGSLLQKVPDNEMVDCSSVDAVACVPKGSDAFQGLHSIDIGTFLNKGNNKGSCTTM